MSNRLIYEKSPYLRQHAENPVDWYPWGAEAFEKAKREDKPVFLSIGYSTCHWCHVMAHESFEDQSVAEILNKSYVPVKVDREERPDVDSVYMQACVAANGSGGWPLTAILTPDQEPFFIGTYFPKENRGGRMGLRFLLTAIAEKWSADRAELLHTASEMTAYLKQETATGEAAEDLPRKAMEQLMSSYDKEYGGFGWSTKFPSPHNLLFLMEYAAAKNDRKPREAVEHTLRQMYRGGIYDHFGGGFCRYSTDREWLKPHFEKTLYDNALLALTYTEAWQDGHMALWRETAENTLDYCLRELKAAFTAARTPTATGRRERITSSRPTRFPMSSVRRRESTSASATTSPPRATSRGKASRTCCSITAGASCPRAMTSSANACASTGPGAWRFLPTTRFWRAGTA